MVDLGAVVRPYPDVQISGQREHAHLHHGEPGKPQAHKPATPHDEFIGGQRTVQGKN